MIPGSTKIRDKRVARIQDQQDQQDRKTKENDQHFRHERHINTIDTINTIDVIENTKMRERRIRIDLAYDGTDFAGWQWQERQRTVQGVVEAALSRLAGDRPVRLRAASRTDSGVHARQQVADCLIVSRLDDGALAHALAKMLPPDVRPLRVRTTSHDFNSMKQALRKTYRYTIDRSRYGDPLAARWTLHHPRAFDVEAVRRGLRLLLGKHDWSGFADSRCRIEQRVRELYQASYHEHDGHHEHDGYDEDNRGLGRFTFSADGFLTYMVRNMVGTLLEIGRGKMAVDVIERILASGDRRLAAATAPARGLCLWRVVYSGSSEANRPPRTQNRERKNVKT